MNKKTDLTNKMRDAFKAVNKLLMDVLRDANNDRLKFETYRIRVKEINATYKNTNMEILQNFVQEFETIFEVIYTNSDKLTTEDIQDLSEVRSSLFNLSKNKNIKLDKGEFNQLVEFRKELISLVNELEAKDETCVVKLDFVNGIVEYKVKSDNPYHKVNEIAELFAKEIYLIGKPLKGIYSGTNFIVDDFEIPYKKFISLIPKGSDTKVNFDVLIKEYANKYHIEIGFMSSIYNFSGNLIDTLIHNKDMSVKDAIIESIYDYVTVEGEAIEDFDSKVVEFLNKDNTGKDVIKEFRKREEVEDVEIITSDFDSEEVAVTELKPASIAIEPEPEVEDIEEVEVVEPELKPDPELMTIDPEPEPEEKKVAESEPILISIEPEPELLKGFVFLSEVLTEEPGDIPERGYKTLLSLLSSNGKVDNLPESMTPSEIDWSSFYSLTIPQRVETVDKALHHLNPLNIVKGLGGGSNIDTVGMGLANLGYYASFVESAIQSALSKSPDHVRRAVQVVVSAYMYQTNQSYLKVTKTLKDPITVCITIQADPEFSTVDYHNSKECYNLVKRILGTELVFE